MYTFTYTKIKNIYIPENTTMDAAVFAFCYLDNIEIHPNNKKYRTDGITIYKDSDNSTLLYVSCALQTTYTVQPFVTTIANRAFCGSRIPEVVLPQNSVVSISTHIFMTAYISKINFIEGYQKITTAMFQNCASLAEISLPNSINTIDSYAFAGCTKLQTINLPENLTTIGSNAFKGCLALKYLELPSSVTDIGQAAFSACPNLFVNVSKNTIFLIKDNMLFKNGKQELGEYFGSESDANIIIPAECKIVGASTFSYKNVNSITFSGNDDLSVGETAFMQSTVVSIEFPPGLKSLGQKCFHTCPRLTTVSFTGNLLTSIPDYCFYYCPMLNNIKLPSSVTSIGVSSFQGCPNIGDIGLSSTSVSVIGQNAFFTSGVSDASLPGTITRIDYGSFCNSGITKVVISCSSISQRSFSTCTSLINATLCDGVESIDQYSFNGCSSLEYVYLPVSIRSIGEFCFLDCFSLKHVFLAAESSLSEVKGGVFVGCTSLTNISVSASDSKFVFENGALMNRAETNLITFLPHSGITTFAVPPPMETIGAYAFMSCRTLVRVIFSGSNIKRLSYQSFKGCSKLSFIFFSSSSLTTIDNEVFSGCPLLRHCGSISCPPTLYQVFLSAGLPQQSMNSDCHEYVFSCNYKPCSTSHFIYYSVFIIM